MLALLLERRTTDDLRLVVIKCEELVADLDANTEVSGSGEVENGAGWFEGAVERAAESSQSWGKKKDQRKVLHPLKHQRKLAPNGTEICRYQQFATCHRRDKGKCEYEHGYCYECLEPGHTAVDCTAFLVGSCV